MVHSGWKGTASEISFNAVNMMKEKYGSRPENIYCVIGPHICKDCYEVSFDLIPEFEKNFDESEVSAIFTKKENGKYLLNLSEAIRITLKKAGLRSENIKDINVCTFESNNLDSYRRDKENCGRMLTGIVMV